MDQPRRQRVSQLASRQTRVISGNRRRGYTSDDEEDASALRCGSIEDLGEDAIFPLQAGDHEDCEVIMSRADKLTALEGLMLPSKVISRIVKADNKLRANRRAANRREENKKKLDAELNQAIAARLSQPRGHTVTGSHEDQFYVNREAFDKALESYDSLCKEYGEKPATTTTKADPTTTETDPTTTKTAHIIREQLIQLREQLLA